MSKLWQKPSSPSSKAPEFTTVIDEGSEIEGKFTFTGIVLVNGRLRGEIVSNDTLVIGERGIVNATVRAGIVQISGEVVGDVFAAERVELRAHARVYGDVEAPVVVIEEGALFEGQCRMNHALQADAAPQPTPRDSSVVPLKGIRG